MSLIDLTGERFSKLTVIKRVGKNSNGNAIWLCECDCGNDKAIVSNSLISGNTKSCGCIRRTMGKYNSLSFDRYFPYMDICPKLNKITKLDMDIKTRSAMGWDSNGVQYYYVGKVRKSNLRKIMDIINKLMWVNTFAIHNKMFKESDSKTMFSLYSNSTDIDDIFKNLLIKNKE
jgi:hypothetical protein